MLEEGGRARLEARERGEGAVVFVTVVSWEGGWGGGGGLLGFFNFAVLAMFIKGLREGIFEGMLCGCWFLVRLGFWVSIRNG